MECRDGVGVIQSFYLQENTTPDLINHDFAGPPWWSRPLFAEISSCYRIAQRDRSWPLEFIKSVQASILAEA